jgi:hypothetical protein
MVQINKVSVRERNIYGDGLLIMGWMQSAEVKDGYLLLLWIANCFFQIKMIAVSL